MTVSIAATDLTKIYSEGPTPVTAVSSVSLEFREGDFVGIFGPSGSGKTTLLSLLGCILRPTSGSLKIYGDEVSSLSENELPAVRKRYISFIFQGYNLFPALTVYENVMLVLSIKGVPEELGEGRTRNLLTTVGLGDRIDFLPRDLSGGQKQRTGIVRALASDSPIILADEPTGNLDLGNGLRIMEMLKMSAEEHKRCVVVATHDRRMKDYFTRVFYLQDGRIGHENNHGEK